MQMDMSGCGGGPLGLGATGTIGPGGAKTSSTHAPSVGSISQTTADDSPKGKTGLAGHGRGSGTRRDRIDAAALTVESGHRPMTFILGHGTYDHSHARHGRLRACGSYLTGRSRSPRRMLGTRVGRRGGRLRARFHRCVSIAHPRSRGSRLRRPWAADNVKF